MNKISFFGKLAFVVLALGTVGAFAPASAEASERVVVRTERRWVAPRYETRFVHGYRQNVIVRDGYWADAPVYSDVGTYYSTPNYSYPDYSYSYPSYDYSYPSTYYYSGYPRDYGYGYRPGVSFDFRFGGSGHRHWR